jgi:hypothetical protein
MSKCPNCAAAMTIAFVGDLKDKRLRCSYCTYEIDLPDSYSETEEQRSEDGRSYIRKTVTRSDGVSPLPESFLKSFGLDESPEGAQRFTLTTREEVSTSAHVVQGSHLSAEALSAIEELLQSEAKPGQRIRVVRGKEEGQTTDRAKSLATKVYAWASLAAAVVALALFGQKGLFVAVCALGLGWAWRAWRAHE